MMPIISIVALVSLCVDWQYRHMGGRRSTPDERRQFFKWIGIGALTVTLWPLIGTAAGAGYIAGVLLNVLLWAWAYHRWQVRKHCPVPDASAKMPQ